MLLSSWAARWCASSRLNACGGRTANPPCPVAALAQGMLSKTPQLQELAPLNCMHLWQHDIWRSSLQGSQHNVTCSMPAGCQGGQGGGGSQAAAHRKCCAAEGSPQGGPVLPAVLSGSGQCRSAVCHGAHALSQCAKQQKYPVPHCCGSASQPSTPYAWRLPAVLRSYGAFAV